MEKAPTASGTEPIGCRDERRRCDERKENRDFRFARRCKSGCSAYTQARQRVSNADADAIWIQLEPNLARTFRSETDATSPTTTLSSSLNGKGNPNSSISCRRNLCHGDLSDLVRDGLDTRDVAVLHVQVRFGVLFPADKARVSKGQSEADQGEATHRRLVVGLTGDLLLQHSTRGSDETEERR